MKKRVFPRIILFLFFNCVVFVLLAIMQFTYRGNFSQPIGDMLISGHYAPEPNEISDWRPLDGGAKVFFGGLEFQMTAPKYISITGNGAAFILPSGAEISFTIPNSGTSELQINGKFSNEVTSVEIPIKTRRSSVIRNNGDNTPSILYNGSRYQFNRPLSRLESGQLVLLVTPSVISSYRPVSDKKEFHPVDYIIPQAQTTQGFSSALSRWIELNFALWSDMGTQPDEDTIIAWCAEAVRQRTYPSAVSVIPASFSSSPLRTWESAVYQFDRKIGVWEKAAKDIGVFEQEKFNHISRLLEERNIDLLKETHLIEFLAVRNYHSLTDDFLAFAHELNPSAITLEMCPGILENSVDMNKWHPNMANPFESFAEQVLQLAANNLRRAEDHVFAFSGNLADMPFNLRLGMALHKWSEKSGNTGWAGIGRSLALSVLSSGRNDGVILASQEIGVNGEFISSGERISSAKLYRLLDDNVYLPHAAATRTDNIWAWTAAASINITQSNNQMNISIQFPAGETHYVMLRNMPPFALLQFYKINWRRAVDFESYYDSSGWYYFEQERTLVIKIRHRSNIENIGIYFTVPRSSPQAEPPQEEENPAEQQQYTE